MPPVRGTFVSQADMDALAALANTKLRAKINAVVVANHFPQQYWTPYDSFNSAAPTTPISAYKFDATKKNWLHEYNRMRGNLYALIFGRQATTGFSGNIVPPALTQPPLNAASYLNPAFVMSGKYVVSVNDPLNFPETKGKLLGSITDPNDARVKMSGLKEVEFWCDEIPDGFGIKGTMEILEQAFGQPAGQNQKTVNFTLNYSLDQPGDVTMLVYWNLNGSTFPDVSTWTKSATPSTNVTWSIEHNLTTGTYFLQAKISWFADDPASGTITFSSTAPTGITFASEGFVIPGEGSFFSYNTYYKGTIGFGDVAAIANSEPADGLGKSEVIQRITIPETGDHSVFRMNDASADTSWLLSDITVPGLWVAKTFPTPGINTYLDTCLPPYVSCVLKETLYTEAQPIPGTNLRALVAIAPNGQVGANLPLASSVRQAAPVQFNQTTSQFESSLPKIEFSNPGITPRSTKWPAFAIGLKDFDFNYYFAAINGNGSDPNHNWSIERGFSQNGFPYYAFESVPSNTLKVQINLYGDAVQKTPISAPLKIYLSTSGVPDPTDSSTYDFVSSTGEINIPPDGGENFLQDHLLNSGYILAIVNENDAPVTFTLVATLTYNDLAGNLRTTPRFFPARADGKTARECYSFSLREPKTADFTVNQNNIGRKIPQSGYCIHKIRITRTAKNVSNGIWTAPQFEAGNPLSCKIGIYVAGVFKPFKNRSVIGRDELTYPPDDDAVFLIPADKRDSGDISVFWPVTQGTYLTYQEISTAGSMDVEAWVNFQPMMVSQYWGQSANRGLGYSLGSQAPTMWKSALEFMNDFWPAWSDPSITSKVATTVQFPLCVELYNEMTAALNLLD